MKKLLLTLLLLLAVPGLSPARVWTPSVSSELSNPTLTALAEGSDGYLWIGTRRGLNRFNGSTYKQYFQGDSAALSSDRIFSLCPDTDGRLWVGTEAGINLLRNSRVIRTSNPKFFPISDILNYDENRLILACQLGLQVYDKKTGESTTVFDAAQFSYSHFLVRLPDGSVAVAGRNNQPEVAILGPNFSLIRILSMPRSGSISGMEAGPDGTLFVATDKGIHIWAPDGREVLEKTSLIARQLGESPTQALFLETDPVSGRLVAGFSDLGLFEIDPGDLSVRQILPTHRLNGIEKATALVTRDFLWISSNTFGLFQIARDNRQSVIQLQGVGPNDFLTRLIPWSNNMALVQTQRKILLVNTVTGVGRDLTPEGYSPEKNISQSRMDRDGHLWVIYDYETIFEYEVLGDRLRQLSSWPVSGVRSIWENEDGSISFIQENRIHTIRNGERSSRPISRNGEYWRVMPTSQGHTYFIEGDKIYRYTRDGLFLLLPLNIPAPNCLTEDAEGRVWIGSMNAGLYCYDPVQETVRELTVEDGLPDNSVRTVMADEKGLWVSFRNEIAFISQDLSQILPLPLDENIPLDFVSNACITGTGGQIIFGANQQLAVLSPKGTRIQRNLQVHLEGMLINNQERDIPKDGQLVLPHDENLLMFYFSATDFEIGKQLNYAYKLEGHDSRWIHTGADKRAFYSNLGSGKYRFRVKVLTPDGTWHEEQQLLRIRIKSTPLLSTTAKLLYAIFGLALLGTIYLLWTRSRRNKERAERAEMEKVLGEQLSRDKTDFFMNISHEYRTPLSLIYGPARELSRNNELSEHDRHLVRLIERNTEKMMTLTEQIVNFDKFARSTDHLAVLRTDIGAKLTAIAGNFDFVREQRGLTVREELPENLMAWCDWDKIEKIFFNLFSNAFKYTPDGGTIEVSATLLPKEQAAGRYRLPETDYAGPYVEIRVGDSGIGIEPDQVKRIFERYERLGQKVGEKVPEGLGLGLNHVLYLIGLHRGAIRVDPNRPEGTVFSFVFPAEKEAYAGEEIWHEVPVEASGKLSEPEPAKAGNRTVNLLIVEDNAEMRTYLHDLFRTTCNIMLAGDGEEALRFIQTSAPDLIISGVMMPFKDGFQLCRELKESEEWCHVPVILLTAKSEMSDQLEGLGCGADAYLQKPFDPSYLQALVQNLLANRRRIQKLLKEHTAGDLADVLPDLQVNNHDKVFLEKIYGLIEEHLSEEDFNVSTLAAMMGMSRSGLFSKVKDLTGQSPQEFLINYRLSRARELLKTHEYNISEVAYKVGFSTLNGLSRAFKNKYGVPPSSV